MPAGGKRQGAGRKPVSEEVKARELSQAAIVAKFGSLQKGLQFLLQSEEPALIKFVFEHALGKPTEKHELSGPNNGPIHVTGMTIV